MSTGTASVLHRADRVDHWLDELGDVTASVATYPPAARRALCRVLQAFLDEGGHRPQDAAAVHEALRALRALQRDG